jgi:hypothetical protein
MECLQYAINQVLGKGEQGSDIAQTLVTSHVSVIIATVFTLKRIKIAPLSSNYGFIGSFDIPF